MTMTAIQILINLIKAISADIMEDNKDGALDKLDEMLEVLREEIKLL
jgi:hypothetical protein